MPSPFNGRFKRAAEEAGEPRPFTPTRAAYVAYMTSDAWGRRRAEKMLLNMAEYGVLTCAICGEMIDFQQGQVAVVHHITYARFGHEHPDDLEVVHFGDCHNEADRRRAVRANGHLKPVREAPRVHPDQLGVFAYFTAMNIEDVVTNVPMPD